MQLNMVELKSKSMRAIFFTAIIALTYLPFLCLSFKKVNDGKTIVVTSENFDEYITNDKFALVLFFAPWQESCEKSHEVLDKVADFFNHDRSIIVAKANIYSDGKLASRFDIEDYCKIKYFVKGSKVAERYDGYHTFTDLMRVIQSKSRVDHGRDSTKNTVIQLDDSNFERIVKDTSKDVMVYYYTEWCIKCKNLTDVVRNVADNFKNEPSCLVAKLDGEKSFDSAVRSKVGMYPTFVFFPKKDKDGQVYLPGKFDENWSEKNLTRFLNLQCDTKRITGGYLDQTVGRLDQLDVLARHFMRNFHRRDKAMREAIEVVNNLPTYKKRLGDYYVKVMRTISQSGESFIHDEIQRTQKLILGSLSFDKKDEFTKRRNILQQFSNSRRDEL